MINFSLKEFVDENIQNFDRQNPLDLIKAEKLLKAESKLNKKFTINEIEEFLEYIKNNKQNYDQILNLSVIKNICNDIYPENLTIKPDFENITETEIEEFREFFTPYLKEFISVSIRYNKWQHLINFHNFYPKFFSVESLNFLKRQLHDKNNLIIGGILRDTNLSLFKKNYHFSFDKKFYFLQSSIDDLEFDDDIFAISNSIAKNQDLPIDKKMIIGEIFMAIFHFNASNLFTKIILRRNHKIAKTWIHQQTGILNNLAYRVAHFFVKDQNAELTVLLSIVIFGFYFLSFFFVVSINRKAYIFYAFINVVSLYLASKKLRHHYNLFNPENSIHNWGKISAILLTALIISFVLLLTVGLGLMYVYNFVSEGKFSIGIMIPLIISGVLIFLNKTR